MYIYDFRIEIVVEQILERFDAINGYAFANMNGLRLN